MDPYILKKIKRMAIQAGVDPKLVKKIKPAPYKGCRVNGRGERKIIIENEPSPKDYSNKGIIGIDYDQGDSKEEGLCYPSKEIDYSSRTEPINLCNGDFKCYPTPKALGKLKMSVDLYYDVSPKVLFRWLTEVPKVSYWLGNFKVKVIGKDCPYGVGHVRRLTAPFIGDVDETITIYQPAKYIRYRVSKSKLMKDHIGEIELTPKNGGTQLKWRISYNATTGAKKILRKFFNSVLRSGTKKLKKKLERHIER